MSTPKGVLYIGTNGQGEVVINHPDLDPDKKGFGHIVFSVEQARKFGGTILQQAKIAEKEKSRRVKP